MPLRTSRASLPRRRECGELLKLYPRPSRCCCNDALRSRLSWEKASSGIIFGREGSGLRDCELAQASSVICIDAYEEFPALNLAQATNLVCYDMFRAWGTSKSQNDAILGEGEIKVEGGKMGGRLDVGRKQTLVTTATVDALLDRLEAGLAGKGYPKAASNTVDNEHRISGEEIYRDIRTTVRRNMFTESEAKTWHGILSTLMKIW